MVLQSSRNSTDHRQDEHTEEQPKAHGKRPSPTGPTLAAVHASPPSLCDNFEKYATVAARGCARAGCTPDLICGLRLAHSRLDQERHGTNGKQVRRPQILLQKQRKPDVFHSGEQISQSETLHPGKINFKNEKKYRLSDFILSELTVSKSAVWKVTSKRKGTREAGRHGRAAGTGESPETAAPSTAAPKAREGSRLEITQSSTCFPEARPTRAHFHRER